jgi:hypothetical protein
MSLILDGSNGVTFPNSTTQVSGGKVIQVVNSVITSTTSTQSTSYVTSNLSASITPLFSTSKVLILVSGQCYANLGGNVGIFSLFRGTVSGTNLGNSTYGSTTIYGSISALNGSLVISYLDSPSTTSSQTYTLGMKVDNAALTLSLAINNQPSVMTLLEIAQ